MSSLLEAASVLPNKIEVTDKLPTRVGDVSSDNLGYWGESDVTSSVYVAVVRAHE